MGSVFLVHDERRGELVALKMMRLELAQQSGLRRRFEQEFACLQTCNHPAIVRTLEFGVDDDGRLWYTMVYYPWPTLKAVIAERHRLAPSDALRVGVQMVEAFVHYHARGLVHRDLKPSNILVSPESDIVISDFGLARSANLTRMTKTGEVLGSPAHKAPEQFEGREADARTDVFQWGVILYESLSGERPFDTGDVMGTYRRVMGLDPPPVTSRVHDVPDAWNRIVATCLAKDPAKRYPSARHLLDDLYQLERSENDAPQNDESSSVPEVTVPTAPVPRAARPLGRFVLPLVVAAVVAIVAFEWTNAQPRIDLERVDSLRVSTTVDGMRVTWSSPEPYPSTVRVGTKEYHLVAPVVQHELRVGGLPPGTSFDVAVVLPSGVTTPSVSATTKTLALELLACRQGDTAAWLRFKAAAPVDTRVRLVYEGRKPLSFETIDGDDGTTFVELPRLDERLIGVTVETCSTAGVRMSLADAFTTYLNKVEQVYGIFPFDDFAKSAVASMSSGALSISSTLMQVDQDIAAERAERLRKVPEVRRRLLESLVSGRWLACRQALHDAAALAFQTSVCRPDDIKRCNVLVQPFSLLHATCRYVDLDVPELEPLPMGRLGGFGAYCPPGQRLASLLAKTDTPVVLGMRIAVIASTCVTHWNASFDLSQTPAHDCMLVIRCTHFRRAVLMIRCNGDLTVALHDTRDDAGQEPYLVQRLPAFCLRGGANTINVVYDPLHNLTRSTTVISEVSLQSAVK